MPALTPVLKQPLDLVYFSSERYHHLHQKESISTSLFVCIPICIFICIYNSFYICVSTPIYLEF